MPDEASAQKRAHNLHCLELKAIKGPVHPQNPWPPPWRVKRARLQTLGPGPLTLNIPALSQNGAQKGRNLRGSSGKE